MSKLMHLGKQILGITHLKQLFDVNTKSAKDGQVLTYDETSDEWIPTTHKTVTEEDVSDWGFTKNKGTYIKPDTGIPASDLAPGVIPSTDTFMAKNNPTGAGSFSLNRKANSLVGENSFAEGIDCRATAKGAHAEGIETDAYGYFSHTEGSGTRAVGHSAHAEGFYTVAEMNSSHSEGQYTSASGANSHTEGEYTEAKSRNQHVQGKYNTIDNDNKYAHIVGNGTGTDTEKRSNAHTLDWDGNAWFAGDVESEKYGKLSDKLPAPKTAVKNQVLSFNGTEWVAKTPPSKLSQFTNDLCVPCVEVFPYSANLDSIPDIVQYIGETTDKYTYGHFYKSVKSTLQAYFYFDGVYVSSPGVTSIKDTPIEHISLSTKSASGFMPLPIMVGYEPRGNYYATWSSTEGSHSYLSSVTYGDPEKTITRRTDEKGVPLTYVEEDVIQGTVKWEELDISTIHKLDDLSDVSIDSPEITDYLKYSYKDKKWVNSKVSYYDLENPPRNLSYFNNDVAVTLVKEFPTSFDENYSIIQYAGADEDKFGHFYKANSDNAKYYFIFQDSNNDTIYLECSKDNLFEPIGDTRLCYLIPNPITRIYTPQYIDAYSYYFDMVYDVSKGPYISAINIKWSEDDETDSKCERPDGLYYKFNPNNDRIIGDITWEELIVCDAPKLDELENVNITTPSKGDVLQYDADNNRWINKKGGSGGASFWEDLEDKPFETVGNDFKTTNDALALSDTLHSKIDNSVQLKGSRLENIQYVTNDTHYMHLCDITLKSYSYASLLATSSFWGNQHGSADIIFIQNDTNASSPQYTAQKVHLAGYGGNGISRVFFSSLSGSVLSIYVYVEGGNSYGAWNVSAIRDVHNTLVFKGTVNVTPPSNKSLIDDTFASVARSGSYTDLINKPAMVESDKTGVKLYTSTISTSYIGSVPVWSSNDGTYKTINRIPFGSFKAQIINNKSFKKELPMYQNFLEGETSYSDYNMIGNTSGGQEDCGLYMMTVSGRCKSDNAFLGIQTYMIQIPGGWTTTAGTLPSTAVRVARSVTLGTSGTAALKFSASSAASSASSSGYKSWSGYIKFACSTTNTVASISIFRIAYSPVYDAYLKSWGEM